MSSPSPLFTGGDSSSSGSFAGVSVSSLSKYVPIARFSGILATLVSCILSIAAVSTSEWVLVERFVPSTDTDPGRIELVALDIWNADASPRLQAGQAFAVLSVVMLIFSFSGLLIEQLMGKRPHFLSVLNHCLLGASLVCSAFPMLIIGTGAHRGILAGLSLSICSFMATFISLAIYSFVNWSCDWHSPVFTPGLPTPYSQLDHKVRAARWAALFMLLVVIFLLLAAVVEPSWARIEDSGRDIIITLFPTIAHPRLRAAQAFILLTVLCCFTLFVFLTADMRLNRTWMSYVNHGLYGTTLVFAIIGVSLFSIPEIKSFEAGLGLLVTSIIFLGVGFGFASVGYYWAGWKGTGATAADPYTNVRLLRAESSGINANPYSSSLTFEHDYPSLAAWFDATGTTLAEQEALRNSRKIVALFDVPLTPVSALRGDLSTETLKRWSYGLKRYGISES